MFSSDTALTGLTRIVLHAFGVGANESGSVKCAQLRFLVATETEGAEISGGGHDEFLRPFGSR